MNTLRKHATGCWVAVWAVTSLAADPPRMQAVPQPYDRISFQQDGVELARYHFGPAVRRPFLFPILGPSGQVLTRMGHPRDPVGHSYHASVWIAHQNVKGVNFWEDREHARIVHQRVELLDDGADNAMVIEKNSWIAPNGAELLSERRTIAV